MTKDEILEMAITSSMDKRLYMYFFQWFASGTPNSPPLAHA